MTVDSENRMLTLSLHYDADVDYVNITAAMIRELPGVLRVRVNLDTRQLEILHEHPCKGLLHKIHVALLWAGTELMALRA